MKKRTGALLMALVMLFGLMAPAASAVETAETVEAVYLGLKDFDAKNIDSKVPETAEDYFVHRFFVDGEEVEYTIATGKEENYAIQNELMEGYIYSIVAADGVVTDVELQDKGVITMGVVTGVAEGYVDDVLDGRTIDVGDEEGIDVTDKAFYEITTQAGGATVTEIDFADIELDDTVKVTEKAVYKAFVAEDYEAPVAGTPGETTLKNFLTTALQPVGTALYVYGGAWDWQDDVSSNQSMTIGIPQSWIDFFQSQDTTYDFKHEDENGKAAIPSYYTSNRGWNQYYYAGVDCSAYTGWIIYNITNTESSTDNANGYVGSSTKQAKNLADKYKWGTWNHDTAAVAAAGELKVGDIVSMSGHVWVVLGVCDDGSVVFMHSTPSNSRDGAAGGGIQIASLNPNGQGDTNCEAYQLADYYMSTYYPQWYERYAISQKSYTSYLQTYTSGTAGTWAGVFSWDLSGKALLTDPDGYADMTPTEILADLYDDDFVPVTKSEAVYLGVKDYANANGRNKDNFQYRFFVDGEEKVYTIENDDVYSIQNELQNGYIFNISARGDVILGIDSADESVAVMGEVTAVDGSTITVGSKTVEVETAYEIESPVAASGAVVKVIDVSGIAVGDTVKVTENAVYKAFVAEDYEPPVDYTPGQTTLRNFLSTALHPVGTALYVYGGAWDWQDDVSSNQTMTIGIPQSWIDFYQSQDTSYTYRARDEEGNDDLANSYYWRRYNEFYWAGVDCSAYVGWVVYNTMNTESATVSESSGYVGSATAQANRFANTEGWGTFDIGHYQMNEDGTYYADGDGDCRRYFNSEDYNVGDVFSDNGHVWIVIGKCDDGSIVFTHSTPSDSADDQPGGGIQLAALDPNDNPDCEAKALADYYNAKYFPEWNERYGTDQKAWSTYTKVYDTGTPADGDDYSMTKAGKFSWALDGTGILTDPDGFADMSAAEILANLFGEKTITAEHEAVYLGVKNFTELDTDNGAESTFIHQFAIDGVATDFMVEGTDPYVIQNQLMEGYIYNITTTNGAITGVELLDKGNEAVVMGTVKSVGELGDKPVYEITTQAGGATVTKIAAADLKNSDTVKVTANAVYKTFVAKEYTAPVAGTPGVKTLKNFLTTALQPVGTALYVYGGAWDWQDDVSSNQSMTIGIPQSWIDFFQAQDTTYDFKHEDENGKAAIPGYYTSNRGWNQYYYAGVDCSAYTGWIVYNVTNTESSTDNANGYVGSSTKQAKNFAEKYKWGTWNHDTAAVAAAGELKVGDIVSMSGHVWVCLGVCEDGSVVFMHSTPSDSRDGYAGGGIQIASLNPNGQKDTRCEAYKLADYYMETYYPQWYDRYEISQKSYTSYLGTSSNANAGVFSWDLSGNALLSDPEGYADMTPAEILMDIFGDDGIPTPGTSKPSIRDDVEVKEPSTDVEKTVTYTDVPETYWAYEAIEDVTEAGLFNGTSADTFSPEAATTRGQLMTVLARQAGVKAATIADGTAWAVANGISDGTDADANITREQLVTMLYRAAGEPAVTGDLAAYTDAASVSDWAVAAMTWAVEKGIVTGMTETTLVPGGNATRAQIATIMQRYAAL